MKLDHDCIRDVLLAVESCEFGERINLNTLGEKLPEYQEEQLWYTCLKLGEGGYLEIKTVIMRMAPMPGIKQISGLTFQGHEFLDSIRENKNWDKAKKIAQKAGVFSVKALGEIAQNVAAAAVIAALQSHP